MNNALAPKIRRKAVNVRGLKIPDCEERFFRMIGGFCYRVRISCVIVVVLFLEFSSENSFGSHQASSLLLNQID